MPILDSTQEIKYPDLPFVPNEEDSIIFHLATQIDTLKYNLPIFLSESEEKKKFIEESKNLADELKKTYGNAINTRVFKLKLMPPGRVKDIFSKVKRPFVIPNYDVVITIVCDNESTAKMIQENTHYKQLVEMFQYSPNHNIIIGKNSRKAGETHIHDAYDKGVYLFNYFYVEDIEFDFVPVWNFTGRWFVKYTNLDNSYLIKPVSGDTHFQYINYAFWNRLTDFVPQLIFVPSLKSYVLDNFSYNHAIAFPIIYKIA